MHVAFALMTLFPGRVGGSESNVRGLLAQFAQANGPERVTVLANRRVMDAYRGSARGPVALRRMAYRAGDGSATRLLAMTAAGALPALAARGVPADVDVVHHPLTVPIPRPRGVPAVTTVYDVQHHELPQFFSRAERAYRRWAYDRAARAADVCVTTSAYSRERLVELAGADPERVVSVPLGIDHERFHPSDRDDADLLAGLELPERYVVYPANLWPHKNHRRLIEALATIGPEAPALVLTGQDYGRAAELTEHARAAGAGDHVRHLGYLQPDHVPALLRGAEALVFPSLYEGFGSPPLEAMACGTPVATSGAASLGEVAGDAALVFDPTSVEAIAAAIERISTDAALRERLRASGLRRAAGFTWQAAASAHSAIYERARATSGVRARS